MGLFFSKAKSSISNATVCRYHLQEPFYLLAACLEGKVKLRKMGENPSFKPNMTPSTPFSPLFKLLES